MTAGDTPSIPSDTYEELIEATFTALKKHGYMNLTVRDIDREWTRSRQLINYYFDGKSELITALLEDLLEYADERLPPPNDDDANTELVGGIERLLFGPGVDSTNFWDFLTAIYEIQAQAHRNPDHQELLIKFDRGAVSYFEELIEQGVKQGEFETTDTKRVAATIDLLITGAHVKKIYLGNEDALFVAQDAIIRLIETELKGSDSTVE
jgi:AcrR family transcriptional regulator